MPPDPNAPTPGTENQIDYDAIETLTKASIAASQKPWDETRCRVCGWPLDPEGLYCCPDSCSMRPSPAQRADARFARPILLDPATVLALVRKARQRDAAERGIGDCIKEISVSALTGEIPDRAFTKGRLDGLGFALNALRREP